MRGETTSKETLYKSRPYNTKIENKQKQKQVK